MQSTVQHLHYSEACYIEVELYHIQNFQIEGVQLKACLHRLCNLFATKKRLKSRSGCKGRGNVFLKSPKSRRLKSVASCLLSMHKRLAANEFDREAVT